MGRTSNADRDAIWGAGCLVSFLCWVGLVAVLTMSAATSRNWRPITPGGSARTRPPTLAELTTLTTDVTMRVVRDITELAMVVLEALDELQQQAMRPHGWSLLLWNREEEEA